MSYNPENGQIYYYIYLGTSCFFYYIKENRFNLIYNNTNCCNFKINYFTQINELNLICYVNKFQYTDNYYYIAYNFYNYEIKSIIFKKDFEAFEMENQIENLQNISINECLNMNSFSLIYNNISKKYDLISDCKKYSHNYYHLTNNSDYIQITNIDSNNNLLGEGVSLCSSENFFDFYSTEFSSSDSSIYTSEISSTVSSIYTSDFQTTDAPIYTTDFSSIYFPYNTSGLSSSTDSIIFTSDISSTTVPLTYISNISSTDFPKHDWEFSTSYSNTNTSQLLSTFSTNIYNSDILSNHIPINTSEISFIDFPSYISPNHTDSPKYDALVPIKYQVNKTKEDIVNNITELISSIDIGKY